MNNIPTDCPDCGCAPGELHDFFCTKERCPFCRGQLVSCQCNRAVLDLSEEERTALDEYVDDSVEPLKSVVERWKEVLEEKGRIPW